MGRAAKPIQLHLLEGNKNRLTKAEIDKRKKAEEQLNFKADKIKPPTWLRKEARKYFNRLVKEFEGLNLLKNVDVDMIALYCDALLDYITFTKIIEEEGVQIEHTNKAGETNRVPHPLLTKKQHAFQQMNRIAGDFGLSPVARAKLALNMQVDDKEGESNPFADRL